MFYPTLTVIQVFHLGHDYLHHAAGEPCSLSCSVSFARRCWRNWNHATEVT